MTTLPDAELLRRLVAFDSTSHNSNLPIAEAICDYLDRPGVRIDKNPSADGDKTNLVIAVGPETDPERRGGLVLSGHMDTVPADEPEWRSDPFVLRETEDRYYGRGAVDMKGFVALAVNLAARAEPARLRRPLVLVLTYDEEVGTLGARRFADTWPADRPLPRATVIGEPTSLEAVRLHKGFTTLLLTLEGVSAHSGYPHLGRNAIEPAAKAICALTDLRRALENEICPNREHFPEVPFVPLNVGLVSGGSAVNIVPDRCRVTCALRMLPGMDSAPLVARIRELLEEELAGETLAGQPFTLELVDESPPLELDESSEIYGAVCELTGQRETVSASYATDGGWLQRAGLDCLIFGPGTIEVAHKPNEWMPKDELVRAAGYLEALMNRFCG